MLLLKATLILVAGTSVCFALRRASADARHRVWSCTFAALLALPLLGLALPSWQFPVPETLNHTPQTVSPDVRQAAPTALEPLQAAPVPAARASGADGPTPSPFADVTLLQKLALTWFTGTVLALTALGISLLRVRRLANSASPVTDDDWRVAAHTLAARLGLRRTVRVLTSARVTTPMAGGLWRPTVYLPPSAAEWDAEQRDVVLAHELAHLAARDPQRHLVARAAMALYWFHPLAWLAARQAAAAREQACDEAVLMLGTRPSAYARVLLELAESMQRPPRALATLPMVHRSLLEARVMAILNGSRRPSASGRATIPMLAITAATIAIAAAAPGVARSTDDVRWIESSPTNDVSLPAPSRSVIATPPVPAVQRPTSTRDIDCSGLAGADSFQGTTSTTGGNLVYEKAGSINRTHRIVYYTVDGTRLCVFGENVGPADDKAPPSRWLERASRVVMESTSGSTIHRLVVTGGAASQAQFQVNGAPRPLDASVKEWRDRMLAALDLMWEATMLRGEQTSLRGQITSIHGEETSLRGQITSLHGEVTSMQGRITSLRGEETSMRGRITSIRGQETSLRGQITSARGAITSINGSNYRQGDADRRIADY